MNIQNGVWIWKRRSSVFPPRTAGRHGRALNRDIPCQVARRQSLTPFLPAVVILVCGGGDRRLGEAIGPRFFRADHFIEGDQDLAHAGHEGHLLELGRDATESACRAAASHHAR